MREYLEESQPKDVPTLPEENLMLRDDVTKPTVTANAVLLMGYLGGAATGEMYRLVDADAEKGECVFEHKDTKNRYKVRVAQVSGRE